ncbi:MAG: hypothetical protein JW874_08975 [Spirochaetales bacterium]|nr:hypothetical protein [Spirochaetales bacterium]
MYKSFIISVIFISLTAACSINHDHGPETVITGIPAQSVSSGVAPLGVFFDATDIGEFENDDCINTHISWDFGNAGSGVYDITGNTRNTATGFVAAHVYEQPGTYQIIAAVTDSTGAVSSTEAITVTVSAFTGTTRCISTSGNFDDAPSGAETVTTSDLNTQLDWLTGAADRRLLLRRGETWTAINAAYGGNGPSILGAFGSGDDPLITGLGALTFTGADLRISDLECEGIGLFLWGNNLLALRVNIHDVPDDGTNPTGIGSGITMGGDALFLDDSVIEDNGYFSVYADGSRMSITGCRIDQIRVATSFGFEDPTQSRNVFITNNFIDACRPSPTTGIKWHSRRGVITDNIFVAGSVRLALAVDNGDIPTPANNELGEVLVERNIFRTSINGSSPENDELTGGGVNFTAHEHIVIRNNVFYDMSVAFCDGNEIAPSHDVAIYNNTIYKGTNRGPNHDQGDFFWIMGNVTDMRVYNNIVYTENEDTDEPVILSDVPLRNLVDVQFRNNIYYVTPKAMQFGLFDNSWATFADWQEQGFDSGSFIADPLFVSKDIEDIDAATFLRLSGDSPATDAGGDPWTAYDADLHLRDVPADIGAWEAP